MLLTETQIAADPVLVQSLKKGAVERAEPMSPEAFIEHLRTLAKDSDAKAAE